MRRRLAACLGALGGLLLAGGACAEIFNSNLHARMVTLLPRLSDLSSAYTSTTEEANESARVESQDSEGPPDSNDMTIVKNTEHGPVKGVYWNGEDSFLAFVDIPYGAFEKPFAAPTNPTSWTDPLEYKSHRKQCPQLQPPYYEIFVEGDNDCLTLSVFTPENAKNAPVLFHVYDGNFVSDSAHPGIYGPEYLVSKGVILVLPNYRLGPLGFLCLQNATAPGNAALKDLTLALKWTMNNIQEFGGNSSKIVVSGEGTAGALVQYLALSPMSRDYIKGVIAESGSALAHWAIDRDPIATATKLVNAMNKEITDDIDTKEMFSKSIAINFRPCVEKGLDNFMNETPWQTLTKGEVNDIVFMIGSADHAGMQEAADQNLLDMNYDFTKFLPNDLKFNSENERTELSGKIRDIYFNGTITLNNKADVSLYHTDASYLGPSIRAARLLADAGAKVYFYEFSYVGQLNRVKNSLQERIDVEGAARGDIIGYTFNEEESSISDEDNQIINFMTQLWITFAKEGKPITDDEWHQLKKAEEGSEIWLSIGTEPKVNSSGVHVDRLHLWTELYKSHFIECNIALNVTPNEFLTLALIALFTFKIV